DLSTRALEHRWAGGDGQRDYETALTGVDGRADQMLSGIRDIAVGQARGLPVHHPTAHTVARFLSAVFPHGVAAITALTYADQVIAVEVILAKLTGELSEDVAALGLSAKVAQLTALNTEYRRLVNSGKDGMAFRDVRAARERGQELLREVVALILGRYFDSTDRGHLAARERLLAPLDQELEIVRARARARRRGKNPAEAVSDADTDAAADRDSDSNAEAGTDTTADTAADTGADTDTDDSGVEA
ncbi:MAG: DUF6261 family protein, partial [Myxococcota bacterium]